MPERRIYYFGNGGEAARILATAMRRGETALPRRREELHGHSEFRHRRFGLAAARQLGPDEEVPDRARTRDDEEAWPRRSALHVRRERALPHRHADPGLEPAQAWSALRDAVRRRRADPVRARRP